jgi:hypothetical protein
VAFEAATGTKESVEEAAAARMNALRQRVPSGSAIAARQERKGDPREVLRGGALRFRLSGREDDSRDVGAAIRRDNFDDGEARVIGEDERSRAPGICLALIAPRDCAEAANVLQDEWLWVLQHVGFKSVQPLCSGHDWQLRNALRSIQRVSQREGFVGNCRFRFRFIGHTRKRDVRLRAQV